MGSSKYNYPKKQQPICWAWDRFRKRSGDTNENPGAIRPQNNSESTTTQTLLQSLCPEIRQSQPLYVVPFGVKIDVSRQKEE